MTDYDVTMTAGGIAQWGRALPLRGKMTTVTFEADIMTKIAREGAEPTYFRSLYIGMDEVDVDGTTPRGHGVVRLEDYRTGDLLLGHVDWFMVDGRDKGQFTFDDGTGVYEGVAGEVAVDLEFCSQTVEVPLNSGVPVKGLALIEGVGRLSLRG